MRLGMITVVARAKLADLDAECSGFRSLVGILEASPFSGRFYAPTSDEAPLVPVRSCTKPL